MAHDDANDRYDSPNETDGGYGTPTDPLTRSDSWFARRGFLKLSGVATSGIAAAGLADTASAATTVSGIQFDRVVDAVDDLGMDSSGSQPIDGALDRALQSGTLVEFPPGTYRFEDSHYLDGESRVGIRGTGSSQRDVRFVSPRGSRLKFLRGDNVRSVLLENFSLDHRRDDATLISLVVLGPGGSVLRDIEWLGQTPSDSGSDYNVTVEATHRDGVQLVEHLVTGVDAPSVKVQYPNGVQFLRGGPGHSGEVIIRDLVVHNHNSNGTRYTHCTGVVTIEGGEFVNNQNASVRFGAGDHPSKVSTCTGTYIKADGSRNAADAIRLDASGNGYSGSVFQDVHIDWGDEDGRAVIASPDWGGHGRASFYDCVVRNEGPLPTVFADDPDGYSGDGAFVFENCSFTGAGGDFVTRGREGCVIRDSCIDMPNAEFSGFDTENITNGSCPLPRDSGTSGGDGSSNDDT
ncbi:MAG TPA: hypothetical protein VKA37_01315, partial [Halobacteriales archaeon]|nr:hypothetical protein [Halobacteriales archaeon]